LEHLGIQDASRKWQDIILTPGAWMRAVVRVGPDRVFVLASEKKCWLKAKVLLKEVIGLLGADSLEMPCKGLEQIQGFLM
jgi:hypothetical protein